MPKTAKHRRDNIDSKREQRRFVVMVAVRIVGIILQPILDHWYGGGDKGGFL